MPRLIEGSKEIRWFPVTELDWNQFKEVIMKRGLEWTDLPKGESFFKSNCDIKEK